MLQYNSILPTTAMKGVLQRESFTHFHRYDLGARAFELKANCILCTEMTSEVLLWSVNVEHLSSVQKNSGDVSCLSFVVHDCHKITLQASTEAICDEWVAALLASLKNTDADGGTASGTTEGSKDTVEAANQDVTAASTDTSNGGSDHDRGERAIAIQQKLTKQFEHCIDDDVISNMDAAATILQWLVDILDRACCGHFKDLALQMSIIHPYLVMRITSFASSAGSGSGTALSMMDCLRVMDMLTAYDAFLKTCCSLFPKQLSSERYSMSVSDEQHFLIKVTKEALRPRLSVMCFNVQQQILHDDDPMSHVKQIGAVIATHAMQDMSGICHQFASSADQGAKIVLAHVLSVLAKDLLAAYTVHVQDFVQGNGNAPNSPQINPALLLACANDCLKLSSLIEVLGDQYSKTIEEHPDIEDALQESQDACVSVADICVSTLSDLIEADLMTIETTFFEETSWSAIDGVRLITSTVADYCTDYIRVLDAGFHRNIIRSFLERSLVFYICALLKEGLKVNEKKRLSIGAKNMQYLIRDSNAFQKLSKDLSVDLLGTDQLPKSFTAVNQVNKWFVALLTTKSCVRLAETVFAEMVDLILPSSSTCSNQSQQQVVLSHDALLGLSQCYCFISQSMLLRSALKSELNDQTRGLNNLRNRCKRYGLTLRTLKEAEEKEYTKGWCYGRSGLQGMLQQVCPRCTDQWTRDARGAKKRNPTKLMKKYKLYRPHVVVGSCVIRFDSDVIVPLLRPLRPPRPKRNNERNVRGETKSTEKADPFQLVGEANDVFALVGGDKAHSLDREGRQNSLLDVDSLAQDLLGDLDDHLPVPKSRASSLDMESLERDLLNVVVARTTPPPRPPRAQMM